MAERRERLRLPEVADRDREARGRRLADRLEDPAVAEAADRLRLVDGARGVRAVRRRRLARRAVVRRRLGALGFRCLEAELRRRLRLREEEAEDRLADREDPAEAAAEEPALLGARGTDAFLLRRGDRAVRLRARRFRERLRGAGDGDAEGLGALGTDARRRWRRRLLARRVDRDLDRETLRAARRRREEDRDRAEARRRAERERERDARFGFFGFFTLRARGDGEAEMARFFRSARRFSWNAAFSASYSLYSFVFWYASTSFWYSIFSAAAFSMYGACSPASRSCHMLPTFFRTSVTFMSGCSATTPSRTSFTKTM